MTSRPASSKVGARWISLLRPIQAVHAPETELEVMPARLIQIVQLVVVQVHAAGRDLMQQRLPQMRARLVHQRDQRLAPLAQLVAQAGGELEAAGAAADDDDAVKSADVVVDTLSWFATR